MLKFYGEKILKQATDATLQAMVDVAFDPYVLLLRQLLGQTSPPASRPGEPPHHAIGQPSLADTICIWPEVATNSVHIGSASPMALFLEIGTASTAPRPVWVDSLLRVMNQMASEIAANAASNMQEGRPVTFRDGDNANPLSVDNAQPGPVPGGMSQALPFRRNS